MQTNAILLRTLGVVGAVAIVVTSIAGLGSYSNAKYERALVAAQLVQPDAGVRVAGEPMRVDVVGTRVQGTRTAAHVDESAARPQT